MITPNVNVYYRHRYGGLYLVNDIAKSSVDQSKWVVYTHVYPFQYETWIRPYDEWCDGRFQQLEPGEYNEIISSKDRETFQAEITATRNAAKGPKEGDTAMINGKVCDFRNGKWMTVQG